MKPAPIGRADLIRWAATLDDARLARLAEALGYKEEPEEPPAASKERAAVGDLTAERGPAVPQAEGERMHHRQYRVVERRTLAPPPAEIERPEPPPREPPVEPLGPPPPLVPWQRLWPFLHAALGALAERNRIDLPRLVAACSRAEPLRRLPRLKGQRWAPQGQLILDLHTRLYPFWDDFNALKTALPRLRGETGLEILRMDEGPEGPVQVWGGGAWGRPRTYAPPAADIPVLIAGDLGCLGTPSQRAAWVRLGRRFSKQGRAPVALTPCPPRWWDPALAGLYFPVFLDRRAHIPPRPAGPRPWPQEPIVLEAAIRGDPGAELLLTLLSASIAIRPALLRHLRHRLSADLADAGSEAAAWQHPAFLAGDFALLPGDPEATARLRDAYERTGDDDQRRLAWDLIRAQQEAGASRSDRMEERVLHAAMLGRTDPEAESFLDLVGEALAQAGAVNDTEHARFLAGWVNRRSARMHPDAWRHSPSSEALWLQANPEAEVEGTVLPAGYDIHRARRAQGRPERLEHWRLVQRGRWLRVEPWPEAETPLASGSPVAEDLFTRQPVARVRARGPASEESSLPLAEGAALPLTEAGWVVTTDAEELVIQPMDRPPWAHTLGRDGTGLFVGFQDGQGADRRAYWYPPRPSLRRAGMVVGISPEPLYLGAGSFFAPGSKEPPTTRRVSPLQFPNPWGCFIDAAQLRALTAPFTGDGAFPGGIMEDAHGLFADLDLHGVTQRFRWIWPGSFLMGSPETEAGRFDDEIRHQVVLTRGLWIADTACTQALWEAVMGENRSWSKGPNLPVENLSWEDVQGFIERLNREAATGDAEGRSGPAAALRFRLPSESEWELACRAGTTTAYSFGDAFDPELANNGSRTVAVRSLPPNPWGLYEMHGNVWEWCQDWSADYAEGPVVDPAGPASGGGRVLRGGSWINDAQNLRSAYRGAIPPGDRSLDYGFRLALGPEPGQAGSGDGRPAQGASGSERKARAVRPRGGGRGKAR